MSNAQVVVSGLGWMGSGIGSIESAIEELLENARHEILMTAYAIGKADRIFSLLEIALARGVKVTMIVNRPADQCEAVKHHLNRLKVKYPHFQMYAFEPSKERGDLHAKVLVVDQQRALVGSSNLSYNGMILNYEMAVILSAEDAAQVAYAVNRLVEHQHLSGI